jgi:hypothetical protein
LSRRFQGQRILQCREDVSAQRPTYRVEDSTNQTIGHVAYDLALSIGEILQLSQCPFSLLLRHPSANTMELGQMGSNGQSAQIMLQSSQLSLQDPFRFGQGGGRCTGRRAAEPLQVVQIVELEA